MKEEAFNTILDDISKELSNNTSEKVIYHDYYKFRISYLFDTNHKVLFLFITGLTDNFDSIQKELKKCKKEFINLFGDIIQHKFDTKTFEVFDPTVDAIHRSLRPKISLIGFSGVGKTTITRLIKAEEIPMQHVPTITGDIATIKIGKLHFHLWDFAGQEQFSYLWSNFIKGSDAALLITDSSMENVEKSKFFLDLIREQAPHAHSAVIANKQDLPKSMTPEQIEGELGLKAYSMVAIEEDNRDKMIKIIADVLEMNTSISPLLKPLLERDNKIREAQMALENAQFDHAIELFEKISDLCIDLGDDSLSKEFYEKAQKINAMLTKASKTKEVVKEQPVEVEDTKLKEATIKKEKKVKIEENLKPMVKPLPNSKSESLEKDTTSEMINVEDNQIKNDIPLDDNIKGLDINPEDFMVKERPKQVLSVPKDAKNKLRTSSYGHVMNPTETSAKDKKVSEDKVSVAPTINDSDTIDNKIENLEEIKEEDETLVSPELKEDRKRNLEKDLMDLRVKKAQISKMELDFEIKELSGEITTEELNEKKQRIEEIKKDINKQIEELEKLIKV
ncbi:MAG: GTP-binding protein [Candidatus Lokiarchaeota archaeon]|nr:GTP-binding protein [Candidatus Lokiarchaeota archaeon]